MSDREKKLLVFFSLAGFVILNFLVFNFAKSKRDDVDRQREQAIQKLAAAKVFQESREQVTGEMDWLMEHEPEPKAAQDVQTNLQQFAEREAKSTGLTIKSQKPLPTDATEGLHYHRAKFQFVVTGNEESLYRWFDRLNVPEQFRVASQIRLSPNTQDDTKIDCTATIEQWFIPPTP
jgi:hypothetical protein